MRTDDLITLEVHLHHKTDRAVLVSTDGDRDRAEWVPLALCEFQAKTLNTGEITLPENLALRKGLI